MGEQEKQFMWAVRKLERSLTEGIQFRVDKPNEQYSFYQPIRENLVVVLSQFLNQESFNYLTSEKQQYNKNPFFLNQEDEEEDENKVKNPFRNVYFALTLWDSPERHFRGKPLEKFDNIHPYKQEFLQSFYKLFEDQKAKEERAYHFAISPSTHLDEEIDSINALVIERRRIVDLPSFLGLQSKSYASREEGYSSFL